MPELTTIGAGVTGGGLLGLILKWLHGNTKQNTQQIEELEKMFYQAEIHAARNYVTKDDLKNALLPLHVELEKIVVKLDALNEKKQDK